MIVLLELLTALLEYINLIFKFYFLTYFANVSPSMLRLCPMLLGTYSAQNCASIIGGSVPFIKF